MNVYIVDDASFIRILCRHYIQKSGYTVVGEAFDGQVAIDEISSKQPDCVIMDLALPSVNGVDVMKKINADYPHIQFVVISALDKNFCNLQLDDVKYVKFITKPFAAEQLVAALQLAEGQLEKKKHG